MNRRFVMFASFAALGFVVSLQQMTAQVSPTTPRASSIRIIQGPDTEVAKEFLTIIRWTTNNPGGSPVHYGVVHYGTDPKNLTQTAKSPIRLDPTHSTTVFRVRLDDLVPGRTYYYTVSSTESNGTDDRVKSAVRQFKVPPAVVGSDSPK